MFVGTRTDVKAQEIKTDSLLQRAGDRYKEAFGRLRTFEKMPGTPTRPDLLRRAKGVELEVGTEHQLAELVRLYRHELSMPREYSVLSTARRETLGQFLYSALLDPIEEELRGAGELIFVPDGVMSYLPLEALSDWDHTRVIEKWRVRYVQSLRVLRLLQERHQSTAGADRRSLLAFGDAVYDPTSYITDTSGFGAGTTLIAGRNVPEELAASPASSLRPGNEHRPGNDSTDLAAYWERGYGPDRWHNLPNTLDEVRSLSRIATSSTVMIGEGAREQAMWTLSRSGALAEYRAVHIAAHGFVVPERPGLSALVFSEVGTHRQADRERLEQTIRNRQSGADGYLSMREIAQLNLRADFVGLSACQTGLGRIYRGSGAVSLAHGFLRAGAGSVAVSLWSVDDTSTHHFMEAVYQRAWNRKGASWSEAIARTKRRFAVGDHGERLQSPRFWAPFVYYGWEPRPTSP